MIDNYIDPEYIMPMKNSLEDPRWVDMSHMPQLVTVERALEMYDVLRERYGGIDNPSDDQDLFIVVQAQDKEGNLGLLPLYNREERDKRIRKLEEGGLYPDEVERVKGYHFGWEKATKGLMILVPSKWSKRSDRE